MELETLQFELIDATWEATSPIVSWWREGAGGSYEAQLFHRHGADLLRVLVYHLRISTGTQKNLGTVRSLLTQENCTPFSVLGALAKTSEDNVRKTLASIVEARGSWFGDAVPYLLLNLDGSRMHLIGDRWPLR